jgi:RimJ/RimL family protein N-acetyltransferase
MISGLTLRPFETTDAPSLHQLLNEPELLGRRYLEEDRNPVSLSQVEDLLGKWTKSEGETRSAIAAGDVFLGIGLVDPSWEPMAPFVAVVIDPAYQRQGSGTVALDLLLQHQFDTTPALGAMTWVDEWNEPGLAFATKYGFQTAGRTRREGIRDGKYFDSVGLDLTREEWGAGRGH